MDNCCLPKPYRTCKKSEIINSPWRDFQVRLKVGEKSTGRAFAPREGQPEHSTAGFG
jgi:hypothetical protein